MRNFYKNCNLTENYLFCNKGKSESASRRSSVREKNFNRLSVKAQKDTGFNLKAVKSKGGVLMSEFKNKIFLENLGKVYFKKLLETDKKKKRS